MSLQALKRAFDAQPAVDVQVECHLYRFADAATAAAMSRAVQRVREWKHVDDAGAASLPFSVAPVGGCYSVDGELASFFTAKDEAFMLRRTLSRLTEMCGPQAEY